MSDVVLRQVRAGYGSAEVLHGLDLKVPAGTTTAVLGGSGSGKTTLLRVISGFLRPDSGTVEISGRVVAGDDVFVAPEKRGVGYVRQDGALFPHLSVFDNIAFGLAWPRRRHRERVLELLDLVGLSADYAERKPDQLSGGQQQRIALARALAPRPDLVLLDEPFSSLDTALRASTRAAVAAALRACEATAILVTHDQGEALSFADEVAILSDGSLAQVATPRELYRAPADASVASFLGDALLLNGVAEGLVVTCSLGRLAVEPAASEALSPASGNVVVMVRPEQLRLTPASTTASSAALVTAVEFFGHDAIVELRLPEQSEPVKARVLGHECPSTGDRVEVTVSGAGRVFSSDR